MQAVSGGGLTALYKQFRDHEDVVGALLSQGRRVRFPAGAHLYLEGDACAGIGFLLEGEIRVYKSAENGREITLYEIGPGDTCILNASCILGDNPYPAHAVATAAAELLLVPALHFKRVLQTHEAMRVFVFQLLSRRLTEVMELVNEVAFGKMEERLLDYLQRKSSDGLLAATHQKIANDLGSSREVVTRLLNDLERRGKVLVARNSVKMLDI